MTKEQATKETREIIESNRYMTLATTDGKMPWASPVYYSVDENYNFFFVSSKEARHSKFIESNSQVSLAIFNSTLPSMEVNGVQVEGKASLVSAADLPGVIRNYYQKVRKLEKSIGKESLLAGRYKGLRLRRFYKIQPTRFYTLGYGKEGVDIRVEVLLEDLKDNE